MVQTIDIIPDNNLFSARTEFRPSFVKLQFDRCEVVLRPAGGRNGLTYQALPSHTVHIQTPSHRWGAVEMPNVAIQTPMNNFDPRTGMIFRVFSN